MTESPIGWVGIARLGLVQAALGAIVVLATSTMNRVMVVELHFPALLPGALVALHYAIQMLRPRLGYGADLGRRRTPWIVGGMALLCVGGVGAAAATAWMASNVAAGIALAVVAFGMVGLGVGGCGTALLALLAKQVAPRRRGAAATTVWVMMIAGIAMTAVAAGRLLDPFSPARLVVVTAGVAAIALALTLIAVWRVEGDGAGAAPAEMQAKQQSFGVALAQIWAEPQSRGFALFVFVSMFAYSAQELILEPFVGSVFHLTPGASTGLTGLQHGGVLVGMLLVAVATSVFGGRRIGSMRGWTVGGCLGSALAILWVAGAAWTGAPQTVGPAVVVLGVANGAFAVSAIGAMMGLAHDGCGQREGTRLGLWGAAQAVAFGLGGLVGTFSSDLAGVLLGSPAAAYPAVFCGEAVLFMVAAVQAVKVFGPARGRLPVVAKKAFGADQQPGPWSASLANGG